MPSHQLKITWVCTTINELGGPASHIRNLYRHINGKECRLTLIFCSKIEGTLRDFMLEGGVDAKDMVFIPHDQKRMIVPFIVTLRNIFDRQKPDIVHAFEAQTHVLAGLAASWAGVKKFICHCDGKFLPSTVSLPKRVLYRTLNFFLKGYFTKTVTVSGGLKNELLKNNFRPSSKVQLIHLGIGIVDGRPVDISYPGLAAGTPVIGAISRLSVEKGLDRFIEAIPYILKEIPAAKFVVCGDGDEKEPLRSLAQRLGILDKVEFKPWVRDVPRALQELEVFVMPSHREGLPITLLEAMSLGRLCVASDIEGIREIINNKVDGVIVNTADVRSFADAVISLCRDPDGAVAVGRAAADKVRTYFNIERETREIKELYETCCLPG